MNKRVSYIIFTLLLLNNVVLGQFVKPENIIKLNRAYELDLGGIKKSKRNNIINYKLDTHTVIINDKMYHEIILNTSGVDAPGGYLRITNDSVLFLYVNYHSSITSLCEEYSYQDEIMLFRKRSNNFTYNRTYIIDLFEYRECAKDTSFYRAELNDSIYRYNVRWVSNSCPTSSIIKRYSMQKFWFTNTNGFIGFLLEDRYTNALVLITNRKYKWLYQTL